MHAYTDRGDEEVVARTLVDWLGRLGNPAQLSANEHFEKCYELVVAIKEEPFGRPVPYLLAR